MEFLISHLEAASKVYTHRKAKHLHICINNAWTKLCEYYRLLDASPIYAASLALNPAIKERHFERNWRGGMEDWVPRTKEDVRNFWVTEYKDKVALNLAPSDSTSEKEREIDEFENFMYNVSAHTPVTDEYEAYCSEKPLPIVPPNLIQYWTGQAINSPSLAQMALDLLSVPAMAAECERVFSSAKILVSDHRNRLKDDVIEANECIRYWIRKGYFD